MNYPDNGSNSSTILSSQTELNCAKANVTEEIFNDENNAQLLASIPHFFLPKKTPESEQSNPNLSQIEDFLLAFACKTFSKISAAAEAQQFSELTVISKMLETWQHLQLNSFDTDENFIQNFRATLINSDRQIIPIYIRKQNATVIFQKEDDGLFKMQTFRSSLPSTVIMRNIHDLFIEFPEISNIIRNTELLHSKIFAKVIYDLTMDDIGISLSQITKRGRKYEDVRDVTEPFLVNDLLVGLLSPMSCQEKNNGGLEAMKISKKIRDQVTLRVKEGSSSLKPFRRSGLWMSFKVTLQLKLQDAFQDCPKIGKTFYKIFMLTVAAEACKSYYDLRLHHQHQIDFDLMAQMLANIANRVRKLQDSSNHNNSSESTSEQGNNGIWEKIQIIKKEIFEEIQKIVEEITGFMHSCIFGKNFQEKTAAVLLPSRLFQEYLENNLNHHIPSLQNLHEITKPRRSPPQSSNNEKMKEEILKSRRYTTVASILSGSKHFISEHSKRIWLYDTGMFLKHLITHEGNSSNILNVLTKYIQLGLEAYQEIDPLGISQIFLSTLKVVEELDRRALSRHSLLAKYKSGINEEQFERLLLPHKDDIELLEKALNYFRMRDASATKNFPILTNRINEKSFNVQFVENDKQLQRLLQLLKNQIDENVQEKLHEYHRVKQECAELQEKILTEGDCACRYETRMVKSMSGKTFYERKVRIWTCNKTRLEYQLNRKKESVKVYVRPIPEDENLQKAVIFELYIPSEIKVLREAFMILQCGLIQDPSFTFLRSREIKTKWTEYKNLQEHLKDIMKPHNNDSTILLFGGTNLNYEKTRFSKLKDKPDVTNYTEEDMIRDNWLNCSYAYEFTSYNRRCGSLSFQIRDIDNSSPYLLLQDYLDSWKHLQNEVICNQNVCHADLSVEEFVAFGSIRAGHRIQMRNLFRAISSNSLQFTEEPVLALILQSIWQNGPRSEQGGKWEAHLDFTDNEGFCLEFLGQLEKFVEGNKGNYTRPCILLGAVAVAVRIIELNQSAFQEGTRILKKWRALAKTWTQKMEKMLTNAIIDGKKINQDGLIELKKSLIIVKISSALTFSFSNSWEMAIIQKQDFLDWFHTLEGLSKQDTSTLSGFMQVLLNYAQSIPLQLKLQPKDNELVCGESIKAFVEEKLSSVNFEVDQTPVLRFNSENLVQVSYIRTEYEDDPTTTVTFDLLVGTFLVNGYPTSSLPVDITENSLFLHYFLPNHKNNLAVQPTSDVSFHTTNEFHGSHYEFQLSDRDIQQKQDSERAVIITEARGKRRYILLDPNLLQGHLYPNFIQNYTHWLDESNKIISFKRKCEQDSDYNLEAEYELQNDNNGWRFYDVKNKAFLFSLNSNGFKNISKSLLRLESSENINILIEKSFSLVTAYLPRHNLRFRVCDGCLECVEYPGYYVSVEVEEGNRTLVGLQQGLQLKKGERKLLLLPHGEIHLKPSPHHHKSIIKTKKLYEPSYFVYEYDEVLRRLVGNRSQLSYLYSAALHAVTSLSSGQPDPFTGITGTEMAVRILQSGFIWSTTAYQGDVGFLRIFKFLSSLSPIRKGYGLTNGSNKECVSMEDITWPEVLPSMCAYDGLKIIVDQLLTDSSRQEEFKSESGSSLFPFRGYFKHFSSYNPLAQLRPCIVEIPPFKTLNDSSIVEDKHGKNFSIRRLNETSYTRSVAPQKKSYFYSKNSLSSFLRAAHTTLSKEDVILLNWNTSFRDIFKVDLRENWFQLYEMASKRDKTSEEMQMFTLILSILGYRGGSLTQILNLHYVSIFTEKLALPKVPENLPVLEKKVARETPSQDAVKRSFHKILHGNNKAKFRNLTISSSSPLHRKAHLLSTILRDALTATVESLKNLCYPTYPSRSECGLTLKDFEGIPLSVFNYPKAFNAVMDKIDKWHREKSLRDFAKAVEEELNKIYRNVEKRELKKEDWDAKKAGSTISIRNEKERTKAATAFRTCHENWLVENEGEWRKAEHTFRSGKVSLDSIVLATEKFNGDVFNQERSKLQALATTTMSQLTKIVSSGCGDGILKCGGALPRMDPTSLLQILIEGKLKPSMIEHRGAKILHTYVGALAVIWTNIKRLNRIVAFQSSAGLEDEFMRELENKGHENWSPEEYPEWLCLELELDIMIRRKQVDVAKQMMAMPNGGNGVMQLNMGEGKTSVIVPMLCCVLGEEGRLCRVTVLSSMLNMNYKILSFAIGGILNKRVYLMPCSRDVNVSGEWASSIQGRYEECMKLRGVVLALPEHRLSFRLLAYDNILKRHAKHGNSGGEGLALWRTEEWLRTHARDILDESDELLNAKYQLVYTVGEKIELDGGNIRWYCASRLLRVAINLAESFHTKYGDSFIEFDGNRRKEMPHEFPNLRLLDDGIHCEFLSSMADKILEEFMLGEIEKTLAKEFLLSEQGKVDEALDCFKEDQQQLNKILVYAGYFRRGILALGLSKRWRVEYGVDNEKNFRLMAVPFRAKDCPAERTEFGHPDLAIMLTHLSYYYSGLTNQQLEEIFKILKARHDAESIYISWIELIPAETVPGHMRSFSRVNLEDPKQRDKIFCLMKRHVLVIDFWLSNKVFPRECKQFPSKLVMTSWDLCYERNKHSTTGFSGTNDSSILLPPQISQQDLTSLLDTNQKMEEILLQPENKGHCHVRMGVTCKDILEQVKKDKLKVLIDAGALMLELDNEQIAGLWLELETELEGVLYFNRSNELTVKCKGSGMNKTHTDVPLELTPYHNCLEKIGVFLDDQHTRGTDLKFPKDWRAAVTIGAGMKRDKLIQACMRMRKLGFGQSVTFYLSHEVYDKISGTKEKRTSDNVKVSTTDILKWVKQNTRKFNEDGLLYWAIAGKNYAQRLAAEDIFSENIKGLKKNGTKQKHAAAILAQQCVDDEVPELMSLYGRNVKVDKLVNVIPTWFAVSFQQLKRENTRDNLRVPRHQTFHSFWGSRRSSSSSLSSSIEEEEIENPHEISFDIEQNFEAILQAVVKRCLDCIPHKEHNVAYINLEEEQEKELELEMELEVEDERIIEKAGKTKPAIHKLHENVLKIVNTGRALKVSEEGIQRLPKIFEKTTFWGEVQPEAWDQQVFATTDFISVIDKSALHSYLYDDDDNDYYYYTRQEWNSKMRNYGKTDLFLRPLEYFITVADESNQNKVFQILVLSPFEVNELMPKLRSNTSKVTLHMFSARRADNQNLLWSNSALLLPTNAVVSPINQMSLLSLLLASGNLYFGDMEEQRAFVRFLCFAPMPWSALEVKAFAKNMITRTGFMLPGCEGRRDHHHDEDEYEGQLGFQQDPSDLVRKILGCRHSVLNDFAHVVRLLNERKFIDFNF